MNKQIIFTLTSKFFAFLYKNRKLKPKSKPVKINLGSSLAVYGDWINIDIDFNLLISGLPRPLIKFYYKNSGAKNWWSEEEFLSKLKNHTFIHHRLEYGIPCHNESVDNVYSSHTLEHLFRENAKDMLNEAYRVLVPNGLIRICIPDLEHALKLYYDGEKEKALDYFFPNSQSDYTSRHMYMYDFDMLKNLLQDVGFTNVQRCEYQKGETPDVENLDVRPDETLFVEARKPIL